MTNIPNVVVYRYVEDYDPSSNRLGHGQVIVKRELTNNDKINMLMLHFGIIKHGETTTYGDITETHGGPE